MKIYSRKRAIAHLWSALVLMVGLQCIFAVSAQAVLDLSVSPTDGGNSIRFGKVNLPTAVNAEVRIRITSSDNQQYQVFQRIEEPFTNERGEQLGRQLIQTSAMIGSNAAGTLYVEDVERMNFSEQLIYTSNPDGLSDSFTLIYQVDPKEVDKTGNFFGRILYTVRPVGGGASQEVVLNSFLDADQGEAHVEITSDSGTGQLHLSSASKRDQETTIELKYSGNSGPLKIYQQIEEFPVNEEGRSLDAKMLQFSVAGAEHGNTDYVSPSGFSQRRVLIYDGEAPEDTLVVNYAINDDQEQLAGSFKGMMSLVLEGESLNEVHPFEMQIDIAPVFELSAEYPPEGVSFKKLVPDSPPQTKEVTVTVHTNLGKAYEIVQNMSGPLTNEEGEMIDFNFFTINEELLADQTGEIQFADFAPLESGDLTIFRSDKEGSPAKFKVIYRLKPYNKMPAGDYRTAVVYSLNEI